MRIIDKIRSRENLTPTESALAIFLQEHSREACNMSLNELSDTLHASKSSVIRFCKKLGFKGHKELCVELAKELDTFVFNGKELNFSLPFESGDTKQLLAEKIYALTVGAVNETWNGIDVEKMYKVARMIHDKKRLYIYAGDDAILAAKEFAQKLETVNFPVYIETQTSANIRQSVLQDPDSIALFIYYNETTDVMIKVAQTLAGKNVPMIVISGPEKGPLTFYGSETISISYYEPSPKIPGLGSLIALELILNVLYAEFFNMDHEKNMKMIIEVDDAKQKYKGERGNGRSN